MQIALTRKQINRSKLKPKYEYSASIKNYCCDDIKKVLGRGTASLNSLGQIVAARHRLPITDVGYNYCPWCATKIETQFEETEETGEV